MAMSASVPLLMLDPAQAAQGVRVPAVFCPEGTDPFQTVTWERREATIRSPSGQVVFRQSDCQFPRSWSHTASSVVASKYFYGTPGTPQRERSLRQLVHRVAHTLAQWGQQSGLFASDADARRFYAELVWLVLHQYGAFNSPVWFNVGLHSVYGLEGRGPTWYWSAREQQVRYTDRAYRHPQASACFILSVRDDLDSIMQLARTEALLFKYGSGTGTDLSPLRSHREELSGGGRPSGPLSFMRIYDQVAAVVRSGGKTRRAAKMQSLRVDHPDVLEFIQAKAREEEKALLLRQAGYPDPYREVFFQNSNLSVRLTDRFMQAVERDEPWTTHWVTRPERPGPSFSARALLRQMAQAAWRCGDPGVQFHDTINRWNPCPQSGTINASNPCSEFMFLDDTACNLASLNLLRFLDADGTFQARRFAAACRIFLLAQEILVDAAGYPTPQVAENSHRFRPLGLGYANLGALLMALALPYDSPQGRLFCSWITALMHSSCLLTSAELAAARGAFDAWEENRHEALQVVHQHEEKFRQLAQRPAPQEPLGKLTAELWQRVPQAVRRWGVRNAQVTVLAPTGTISFMMDCDTTGIEPDIALVKYKHLASGGLIKLVNRQVPRALARLGYDAEQIRRIEEHIRQHDSIEGAPGLKPEHLAVFDCAFPAPGSSRAISWRGHLEMMAAAQGFLSGAISKTVNLPRHATPEEIVQVFQESWRLGLKSVAVYRDGSKAAQPLATGRAEPERAAVPGLRSCRRRLPDTRQAFTHRFTVAGYKGYLTVGLFEDGTPGELFITMAKQGSTIGGLMDSFATAVSLCLQYGVPLEVLVEKFAHVRFEPMGPTSNPRIPVATSVVDYIFRYLAQEFLAAPVSSGEQGAAARPLPPQNTPTESDQPAADASSAEPPGRQKASEPGGSPAPERSREGLPLEPEPEADSPELTGPIALREHLARLQADAPVCEICGNLTVRQGNCYVCYNCGHWLGCG